MRILVTVSSRHGATLQMGAQVADQLRAAGHQVDEIEPDDVESVATYGAVVLGSAVYVDRLGADLRALVERQVGQLREKPVWLFWSGPVGTSTKVPAAPGDVAAMVQRVDAYPAQCFWGRLDKKSLAIHERALVALIDAEAGDFRDETAVRGWAGRIADELERPHMIPG